jgi:putative PIN family toxin of toxin-antitoxin system
MLEEVRGLVELVDAPPLPHPVCRDPDDDELLALAQAAGVDLIISGDMDLLSLSSFEGIEIVVPAEAVRRIG